LVVAPFVIKQFKPKMSYGKRVALGMAIGLGISLVREVLTPAEVKLAREQERIRRREARDAEALARAEASEARLRAEYEDTLANIPPGTFLMPSA
tara:strand:+ start:321 stop:605 length:285 start_codon:yes stop_codon:yes gene_type:complete